MENKALTRQQRYYRRNREKLCQARRDKYNNNEEVKKREKEYSAKWKKEHPYETSLQSKRGRERKKYELHIGKYVNVD